jgi:predicted amidophosphoribosyltransferase
MDEFCKNCGIKLKEIPEFCKNCATKEKKEKKLSKKIIATMQ